MGVTKLIDIIIPCKAEPYLSKLIDRIVEVVKRGFMIHIQREQGLTNAVLHGVNMSTGEAVVVIDADGSHDPRYIDEMVKLLKDYDVVIGSRYVQGGSSEDAIARRIISRAYCKLAKLVLRLKVDDNMSGFIVARREVFDRVRLQREGWKFGMEIMAKGREMKMMEYPIRFHRRKLGRSKTGLSQAMQTLMSIVKLRCASR